MKERIAEIMNYKGLSSSAFADIIEIPRSRVSHIMSGRNKATLEVVTHIMNKFPDINILWLMTGEAEMLNDSEDSFDFSDDQIEEVTYENSNSNQEMISPEANSLNSKALNTAPPLGNIYKNKNIDRVLIFYKDGSFKEYTPE